MDQMFDRTFEPLLTPQRDTCFPIFRREPVRNAKKSLEAGRDIYDDVAFVEIHTPGDKTSIPKHRVTDQHKARWPREWAAFERGLEVVESGTPVEMWPTIGPAHVKMLKASGIHTVETLAEFSENNPPRIPDFFKLKKLAGDWLNAASGNADVMRLKEEGRQKDAKIDALNARIQLLESQFDQVEQPKIKRKYTKRSATDLPGKHD